VNISLKTWLYVAGIAIVLLAIGIGGKLWLEDHDGHIRAVYELKDLHAQIDKLGTERDQLKADRQQIQKDTDSKVSQIAQERDRALRSAEESAVTPAATSAPTSGWREPKDPQGKDLPDAPSQLVIKDPQKLDEYVFKAEACTAKLAGCAQQLENLDQQNKNLEAQLANQAQQISVIDSEKNGTKKSKLKWAAVGAFAGGLLVAILKKH
jgi:hypothetical protein